MLPFAALAILGDSWECNTDAPQYVSKYTAEAWGVSFVNEREWRFPRRRTRQWSLLHDDSLTTLSHKALWSSPSGTDGAPWAEKVGESKPDELKGEYQSEDESWDELGEQG